MGKGKLWPSADRKPLNRSSPNLNHVITSRTSTPKQIWAPSVQGVLLPIYAKYTPSNGCLLHFFWFFRSPTGETDAQYVIQRGSAQGSAFWGLENLNLIFDLFIRKIKKKLQWRLWGKFKNSSNGHNFGCIQHRVVIFGSRVWFLGTANSTVSFKFTSDQPLLPWQRNVRQNRL